MGIIRSFSFMGIGFAGGMMTSDDICSTESLVQRLRGTNASLSTYIGFPIDSTQWQCHSTAVAQRAVHIARLVYMWILLFLLRGLRWKAV
jgi:hypothetical protein